MRAKPSLLRLNNKLNKTASTFNNNKDNCKANNKKRIFFKVSECSTSSKRTSSSNKSKHAKITLCWHRLCLHLIHFILNRLSHWSQVIFPDVGHMTPTSLTPLQHYVQRWAAGEGQSWPHGWVYKLAGWTCTISSAPPATPYYWLVCTYLLHIWFLLSLIAKVSFAINWIDSNRIVEFNRALISAPRSSESTLKIQKIR